MKRLLAFLLSALLVFSLSACGGKTDPAPSDGKRPAAAQPTDPGTPKQADPGTPKPADPGAAQPADSDPAPQSDPGSAPAEPSGPELGAWLRTKTGKFYNQFANGMYMEYETMVEGTVMTVVSATKGDMTYAETKVNGQSLGVTVMDGEYMYAIDHANKMVVKMSLQTAGQEMVDTMIDEGDVDPASMKSGQREIDGKTYDTEEWSMDGARSILCFDGDRLAYMIGEMDGTETVIKVIKTDSNVDNSLFEIPEGYQVISY